MDEAGEFTGGSADCKSEVPLAAGEISRNDFAIITRFPTSLYSWLVCGGMGLMLVGCSDPQESALASLYQQKLDFSVETFHEVVRKGRLAQMQLFLRAGMSADAAGEGGDTPLILAGEGGHGHLVRELLAARADANRPRKNGDTPLIVAARRGDAEAVQSLLEAGANAGAEGAAGMTALEEAAQAGKSSAVAKLMAKSPASLDFALQLACAQGWTEIVDVLVANGANVLASSSTKQTPLMYAAQAGHEAVARVLVGRGANLLAVDSEGRTAAMLAEQGGHGVVAEMLRVPPLAGPEAAAVESISIAGVQLVPAGELDFTEPARFLKFVSLRNCRLPLRLQSVDEASAVATFSLSANAQQTHLVQCNEKIPGMNMVVVKLEHRMRPVKGEGEKLGEVSTVLLRDVASGERMLAQVHAPITRAEICALVRDGVSGVTYEMRVGDEFLVGMESVGVVEVFANRVVVEFRSNKVRHTLLK